MKTKLHHPNFSLQLILPRTKLNFLLRERFTPTYFFLSKLTRLAEVGWSQSFRSSLFISRRNGDEDQSFTTCKFSLRLIFFLVEIETEPE